MAEAGSVAGVAGIGNELWLIHGSGSTDPQRIAESGFDCRYASEDNMFGRASYFAENVRLLGEGIYNCEYAYRCVCI